MKTSKHSISILIKQNRRNNDDDTNETITIREHYRKNR